MGWLRKLFRLLVPMRPEDYPPEPLPPPELRPLKRSPMAETFHTHLD